MSLKSNFYFIASVDKNVLRQRKNKKKKKTKNKDNNNNKKRSNNLLSRLYLKFYFTLISFSI